MKSFASRLTLSLALACLALPAYAQQYPPIAHKTRPGNQTIHKQERGRSPVGMWALGEVNVYGRMHTRSCRAVSALPQWRRRGEAGWEYGVCGLWNIDGVEFRIGRLDDRGMD
jgi:hypothetical protein